MTERFGLYQHEIYFNGLGGATPDITTDLTRIEDSAATVLDPGPFSYVAGSAGSGATARIPGSSAARSRSTVASRAR
jgi:lactate 2-monooxygenase